ncbi:peptidoglycan -binding protein [Aliigemmobacter aestuarii]|uniref:Peptidoglycan-binding protein n=1 Tax=Aliigemmobacter aestuarii TaxID=1445661 RepID=A0A4S3MR04_9RHOB|nr:peptidoglycan -binding protein [Gemmobacter aestuarii]THD84970.1 peptidoglycan -binding protein [Gemmobacter aestuarii]
MALARRGSVRTGDGVIWPGFVDAMTALLMVLMFVLTIFMLVQSVLRETISSQDDELDALTAQVASLADALGLERNRASQLQADIGRLRSDLTAAEARGEEQSALIATLTGQLTAREGELAAAQTRIASFEEQVATLLAERDAARGDVATLTASVEDLKAAEARLISDAEAMRLALATARQEVDAQTEAARLAAAQREALEVLIADLRRRTADAETRASAAETTLTEAETARLADAAALQALRERLAGADAELIAMTLALEEQRKRAEETLTLLAAAQTEAARQAQDVTGKDALLAAAEKALSEEQAQSAEAQRRVALLNEQIAQLTAQLGVLQGLLDAAAEKDAAARVQLESLGSQLNSALAQVAAEQKRRAELEEAERKRLEAEKQDLERFRSEFFGQLRQVLAGREGVRIVGDRFVFSSEVLFNPGAADLAPEGRSQIAGVVATLNEVAGQIPPGIDWVIRVDGHTDNVPLSGQGEFADNWELSQARALSVVRFMQDELGFPPNRMAATGFGEYQPVASGDSAEARAQNRRIELKLTER